MTSYYFSIFKKLRVIGAGGHVNAAPGGLNLNDPTGIFGGNAKGAFLGNTPANSPVWAVLNATAINPAPGMVMVGAASWRKMPLGTAPPAWTDFQVNAAPPATSIVERLGAWITAGKVNDTPAAVIAAMPPPNLLATKPDTTTTVFVASSPTDDGDRPGTVPWNYWETGQIFLTDPQTGATVTPAQFAAGSVYNLVATIGNRGPQGGKYAMPPTVVQAKALVMVFGTSVTPAVELPALSNMDDASNNSLYEVYDMPGKKYELVGFRFNAQDIFDGLAKAIETSGIDLGGLPPDIWLQGQSSVGHVCAKVIVRLDSQTWPLVGDTPLTSNRIAQKNLAPFAIDVQASDPNNPPIVWRNIMAGQAFLTLRDTRRERFKHNLFRIAGDLPAEGVELFLAIPQKSFERFFNPKLMRSAEPIALVKKYGQKPPMPDCTVLAVKNSKELLLELPNLKEEFVAMSIGVRIDPKKIKVGSQFDLTLLHSAMITPPKSKGRVPELSEQFAPGLTFQVSVVNSKRQKLHAVAANS
ncbi:hypothetical protein [Taklimakanibacter deserti]|uniref:hypothetical protein n=1 Tax=Taklimakanibacter deserti TaxID=2267839 RepID=UPI000E6575E3